MVTVFKLKFGISVNMVHQLWLCLSTKPVSPPHNLVQDVVAETYLCTHVAQVGFRCSEGLAKMSVGDARKNKNCEQNTTVSVHSECQHCEEMLNSQNRFLPLRIGWGKWHHKPLSHSLSPSLPLSLSLSPSPLIFLSLSVSHTSLCLSLPLPLSLCLPPSLSLSVFLPLSPLSLDLLSLCLSHYSLSLCLSPPSLSLFVSLCLSLSLWLSPSLSLSLCVARSLCMDGALRGARESVPYKICFPTQSLSGTEL